MVSDACRELLIDAQRFSAKYANGFFNHLPMALVALDRLGADEARLRAFVASYAPHLRLKSDAERALTDRRGLAKVLPELSAGVASQAFHGLIRVAYALESGVEEEIPDALGAWKFGYSELPGGGEERFATFGDAFAAIAKDDRLPRSVEGRSIDGRIARVVALPAFAEYRVADVDLAEVALLSARVFVAGGDFTALHMVTACHAMRLLGPYLGPRALHAFATAILAAYVTIGRPPLAEPEDVALPDDAALAARVLPSDDEHDLKLVYSCLREEAEYGTGWHRRAAAVRLGLSPSS
jgi:hypothetical protein